MGAWTALATLALLQPPSPQSKAVAAFGANGVFTEHSFSEIWQSFMDELPVAATCGRVRSVAASDARLIAQDKSLVQERGFSDVLCNPANWYVSALRLDPCRIRSGRGNRSQKDIVSCARNGLFSEIRLVVQPVGRHNRGLFFPDAALHLSFSIPKIELAASRWRQLLGAQAVGPQSVTAGSLKSLLTGLNPHDAALLISDMGQSRWTFSRAEWVNGRWSRVKLNHGGWHESLSDASLMPHTLQTVRPNESVPSREEDLLDPLRTHPLQGSCVHCHLAGERRPARQFRHLGWGLSGESILSQRTLAEARFAAQELGILTRSQP